MRFISHMSGSSGNLYEVRGDFSRILIECGCPVAEIRKRVGRLSDFVGCLITHEHGDHAKGVSGLSKAGVPIFASAGTLEAIGVKGGKMKHLQMQVMGEFAVMPLDVKHDAAEPLCFIIQQGKHKLLFATDTQYLEYSVKGLTHLCIECNHDAEGLELVDRYRAERISSTHMSLEAVQEYVRSMDRSALEEIHLLHLSKDNADAQKFITEIQKISGVPVYIGG